MWTYGAARTFTRRARGLMALTLGALLLSACSDNSNRPSRSAEETTPTLLAIAQPSVELPPDIRRTVLTTTQFDLAAVGYSQSEYFIAGEASAFTNLTELGSDGEWEVEPASMAPYKTRIVVVRPIDAERFSGTVFVEWLNVSAQFDNPPSWYAGHTEALRRGHAWVFVSAQKAGLEGGDGAVLSLAAKVVNPERYESLTISSDSYSYDIFSQVSRALREPTDIQPLDGLVPERLIAVGQSQSANRLIVYVNAIHPLYAPYDGYLIHSRTGGEFSNYSLSEAPEPFLPTPPDLRVRSDLDVPVLNYQTETDLLVLGGIVARQDDSEHFRLWEAPGTSHSDYYTNISGRFDTGSDPSYALVVEASSIFGVINCDSPMNAGPSAWLFNNAVRAVERWVSEGAAPPGAARITVSDDQQAIVRDQFGNALGGIRSPYLDAPAATLSGEGQDGNSFCYQFGTTALFDQASMAMLYTDRAGYIAAVQSSADAAVEAGFLLREDAERIVTAAGLQWDQLSEP